ncbi:hypothetical protein BH20VER3_BH20VER3_13090 [soil metagenome]
MKTLDLFIAAALLFVATQRQSVAGSATWSTNPASGDWNTAANWTPQTVPSSSSDIAAFATSNQTQIAVSAITEVGGISFKPGADSFTIIAATYPVTLSGSGIINSSGKLQTFLCEINDGFNGVFFFRNSATAGSLTSFGGSEGSFFDFFDTTSAGSAGFDLGGGSVQSQITFLDSATAADATINVTQGAINFFGTSTAANARMTVSGYAILYFLENAKGGNAVATCFGGKYFGNNISFADNATAEEGTYTVVGASAAGEFGSFIEFLGNATADRSTLVINGGMGAGLEGTSLIFIDTTTAGAANITANGGIDGSDGGVIFFEKKSQGGTASITLKGNSELDISTHRAPGVTIGSLAGQGSVLLGANTLTIGSNNQNTSFAGVIQGSGALAKVGTGTLKLSGANTYSGQTTVSAGTLAVGNTTGSGTGLGPVQVNGGTLAGTGVIAGAVTIGSGNGAGALFAPSQGAGKPTSLTLQSSLTFKADATYGYRLNLKKKKSDLVVANGVTIESGAQFDLQAVGRGRVRPGKVATVINNTAATPINGAFANLPDGAVVNVNGNNLQASYSGGDGNDLTLTVEP